jgi:hypothetical protein
MMMVFERVTIMKRRNATADCRRWSNKRSRQPNMNDCPTVCCVADLVGQPCTNLEDCDEYIGSIIRSLLQEGKIIDSGRRRNGQILWVVPENWQ